jgi:hypothetical protein
VEAGSRLYPVSGKPVAPDVPRRHLIGALR